MESNFRRLLHRVAPTLTAMAMRHLKDGAGENSYSLTGGAAKSAAAPPIRLLSRMLFYS
jgi:hypothetical protein